MAKIKIDKIVTQTNKGRDIENSIDFLDKESPFLRFQVKALREKYPNLLTKGSPTENYNCHGLTFANRRTNIFKASEIQKIITDDELEEINKENTLPGDIVLYFGEDGDIEHSAIVIAKPDETLKIPMVLSKWGSLQEVIHSVYACPYEIKLLKFYRCRL